VADDRAHDLPVMAIAPEMDDLSVTANRDDADLQAQNRRYWERGGLISNYFE
jgi:hypothetical protein